MPDPIVSNPIDDTLFPVSIAEGAQGGPAFKTAILTMFDGSEQRCQEWLDPLLRWNVGFGVKNKTDFAALLSFFRARGGRQRGFLFQDPLDNQAAGQYLGTGDGATTQFQLARYYQNSRTQARPITRVQTGSVQVYQGGAAASGWTCDHTTGIVTFGTAPAAGVVLTADYQFYVPCRFDTDAMAGTLETGTTTGWDQIPIVEVREAWLNLPVSGGPAAVASAFPDVVSRQMGGPRYGTQVATSVSGWEERAAQWGIGRLRWEIEEHSLSRLDALNLLAWFRTHAGRAKTFLMRDWTDYQFTNEPMVGSGTTWQLVKRYTDGPMTILRNISQPDPNTLVMTAGGVKLTGYQVSLTGVVTFSSAPGSTPMASGQFMVPVRFDSDSLAMRHVAAQQWTVEGLSVVEVDPVLPAQENGVQDLPVSQTLPYGAHGSHTGSPANAGGGAG
ncbi:MAG: DUF2460 domain-containing protein [Chloroflexi bacterium]|nr:DUF2460 domain-containing protein [Chloroflexota bacterium]